MRTADAATNHLGELCRYGSNDLLQNQRVTNECRANNTYKLVLKREKKAPLFATSAAHIDLLEKLEVRDEDEILEAQKKGKTKLRADLERLGSLEMQTMSMIVGKFKGLDMSGVDYFRGHVRKIINNRSVRVVSSDLGGGIQIFIDGESINNYLTAVKKLKATEDAI